MKSNPLHINCQRKMPYTHATSFT